MKRICVSAVLIALLLIVSAASAQVNSVLDPAALEAFFDGVFSVQLARNKVPGAEVLVVADGEIVFSKGYGFSNLEEKTPMVPGVTLHRPGSVSKILTWLAVMQLVEQGKLDLYTDVNNYLDFSIPARTADNRDVPPITLHHILTHTAGFEEEASGVIVSSPDLVKPLDQYVKEHVPARVFTPGSVLAYSNYGTCLAAYIVERVSGMPFTAYVQENILTPLGMDSTTFEQPLPSELAPRLSRGYRYSQGRYIAGEFEYVQGYPAGGLTTSSHDQARLMLALMNLGVLPSDEEEPVRLLEESTAQTMERQQFAAHPELPGMTYGLLEWRLNGRRIIGHLGDTYLFSTGLYFLPDENVGIYVVYNTTAGSQLRGMLIQAFMDRYFPSEQVQPTPRPLTPGTEANYRGVYHSSRSNFTGVESVLRLVQSLTVDVDSEGYLVLKTGGGAMRFGEIAPGLFQELYGNTRIAFAFQDGRAVRMMFPGPAAYLRTAWYQTPRFVIGVVAGTALLMLVTLIGWIKALFKTRSRQRLPLVAKALAVAFMLLFFTALVLGGEVLTTVDPAYNVPVAALEPSATLSVLLVLTKILMGLGTAMLVTAIYLLAARKGSLWQRLHYVLLTLSVLGANFVLWQLNLW